MHPDGHAPQTSPQGKQNGGEEYGELLKFTLTGFLGGLLAGAVLDYLGLQRSGWGNWLVRTLSGEGESILEGLYAAKQRLAGRIGTMAEAYGWGKVLGMGVPWVVDAATRAAGMNAYGLETFYVPYLYALSDQIGANIFGLLYLYRRHGGWGRAFSAYVANPIMLASLVVIIIPLAGLALARYSGFAPITQTRAAAETIAANLCWLPPLIGFWRERRNRKAKGRLRGNE